MAAERVEGVLELITYTKGVAGAVVCTREGEPLRDSFQELDRSKAVKYAEMAAELARDASPLLAADDTLDVVRCGSCKGSMFRISGFTLHARRKQIFPRNVASPPGPPLRHNWGNIGRMSVDEKQEVVGGEWTRAKPVQLVPDASDRDAGGFADGVQFATDDEAMNFLEEETADEAAEHRIPALQLARGFFEELAQTADSEVDVENALQATAASDTEREDEERDVHRNFFADFYVQQGIVSEKERYQFVDAMLRQPTLMLIVNAGMPLVRLMVRAQLEQHMHHAQREGRGAVFVPHVYHPLLYTVDMVPTQRLGDPLRIPYTQNSSVLAGRETQMVPQPLYCGNDVKPHMLSSHSTDVEDFTALQVDLMHALMHDEMDESPAPRTSEERSSTDHMSTMDGLTKGATSIAHPEIATTPLSIGHVYWLQRQVAADTLVDVDPLGVMLPLVLDPHRGGGDDDDHDDDGGIILDMSSRSGGVQHYSYAKDVASHLAIGRIGVHNEEKKLGGSDGERTEDNRVDEDDAEGGNEDMVERISKTVVISLVSPDRGDYIPGRHHRLWNGDQEGKNVKTKRRKERQLDLQQNAKPSPEDVPASSEGKGDFGEALFDECYHIGIEGRIVAQGSSQRLWESLRGRCESVLCCPSTTADGCRPRAALGAGGEEEVEAAANRFVSLCARVNKLFPYLRRELAQALEYVRSHGGRVVYATQSMNPLENEAVVCSVLTDFKRKYPDRVYRPISLLEGQTEENVEVLRSLMATGQHGLQTWVPLQDGLLEQEVSYSDEGIVAAVASHSWRTAPLATGGDMGFICVIELQEANRSGLPELPSLPAPPPEVLQNSESNAVHSALPWLDADRLRERWGLVICWNEENGAFVAASTAVVQTVGFLRSSAHSTAGGYGVTGYGVRVGSSPPCGKRLLSGGCPVAVSCSLGGTLLALALSDCIRPEHRPSRLLEIPVVALLELMHTARLSSSRLRELDDAPATLATAAESLSERTQTVFLKVALPSLELNPALGDMKLHKGVVGELRKLVILAQARVERRSKTRGVAFLLTLSCMSARERGLLAERVVAISDALRYLLRCTGSPSAEWLPSVEEGKYQVCMEDDEYEVEAHVSPSADVGRDEDRLLGMRMEGQHEWKMRRMEKKLRSLGASPFCGAANDWEEEIRRARGPRGARR